MSAPRLAITPPAHDTDANNPRRSVAETLLLRFLVQRGIIHRSLLKLIEIERSGSGTSLSLVDWLVQRGHISESALTSALSACLKLQPSDLHRFAETASEPQPSPTRHLRLVSSRSRTLSDTPTPYATSRSVRRRTPLQLPRSVRRLA